MARFIVVVLILVAIALLANKYLLGKGDAPPADASATADDGAKTTGDAKAEDGDAGAAKPPVTAGESATAEAVPSADVSTDLEQEAGVEPKLAAAAGPAPTGEEVGKVIATETV